ncbi:MAG: pyruvate:ferredoxin (flavodoxin) oxidoreductase [Lachnospiraceae bacterium]|nr:pyruvate:ferredoxin (flavodoxin) oxidoreductase [Lachnospiraceae bacterium]
MANLRKATMDGNTACAYASYAFTEVAAIFPITPSSLMAELIDEWSATGVKNIFGQTVQVKEMQSEGGASGVLHGSLQAGALTSTYTAAQGLLLMIPNMYKIAGELLPGVFHVSSRSIASNVLSIFGDHQDVMSTRQTGFAILAASNVQQCYHMAIAAHVAAIDGSLPFLHFFDGFRTSHEVQKIDVMDYDDLKTLVDMDAVKSFRDNALNPNHPVERGMAVNPDIFFQLRESGNKYYKALPSIVEAVMNKLNALAGTDYKPFNYYGAPDATDVIISMCSSCDVIKETLDYQLKSGKKLGLVEVHLYRPFSAEYLLKVLPKTVKRIAVLDRTKEPGSLGEPLYLDVKTVFSDIENPPMIIGGRYGLGSKDFTPQDVMAVYANLASKKPLKAFTVGITDDVTYLSLPKYDEDFDSTPEGNVAFKFWGLGSDGTVSANKSAIKIIGDHTNYYAQAYFAYDSKKSGGLTISHLRMGPSPIKASYSVQKAGFIACHNQAYITKYDILKDIKKGGRFLLNCVWTPEELETELPGKIKRQLAKNNVEFYTLNAIDLAKEIGLNGRINMIMQAAFFKISKILPEADAIKYLKQSVEKSYGKQGQDIVDMNNAAIDKGVSMIKRIEIPASWIDAKDEKEITLEVPEYIRNVMIPMSRQEGNDLPVSAFSGREDGTFPVGVTAYEKRGVAIDVPTWDVTKCIQCNQCSIVCPHAVIRPTLLNEEEAKAAPEGYDMKPATGFPGLMYHLSISALDCTGCGVCVKTCPAKEKALVMKSLAEIKDEAVKNWDYTMTVEQKTIEDKQKFTVKGSQFCQPYFQFSGACAGCGETPYAKLITQLFGNRMLISNAAGCSHIWGGSPETPYCTNKKGQGPAWGCSLFEDNAEFGYGMLIGSTAVRNGLKLKAEEALKNLKDGNLKDKLTAWLEGFDDSTGTNQRAEELKAALETEKGNNVLLNELYDRNDFFIKHSQWVFGGDGWAYDIGYGGLDHVLASGDNINMIVFDTEVYSNTGGQSSKATPTAAIAQFAASGKKTKKKDLGVMAMSYGYIYVSQIAIGSDKAQTLKAIQEAESYNGPSLIIAYAPCINHGIRGGMSGSMEQEKRAVEAGYWSLYRFDPRRKEKGENPFVLDSKKPSASFREYLMSEVRYSSLLKKFPEHAEALLEKAEKDAEDRLETYYKLAGIE